MHNASILCEYFKMWSTLIEQSKYSNRELSMIKMFLNYSKKYCQPRSINGNTEKHNRGGNS